MKIGALVAFVIIAITIGAVFVLQQEGREPVENREDMQARSSQSEDLDREEDMILVAEERAVPEPLNPEWPEEIVPVYNACANLEVPLDIKQAAVQLAEQKAQAKRFEQEMLAKHKLPGEIFRGDPNRKAVAFTIDTGTGGVDGIEQILELGRHYGISFTFFLTGCWVLENPELTQKIAKEGHGIGNHTLTHLNLASTTDVQARREIGETQRILGEVLGWQSVLFRKPQYAGGERVVNLLAEYDMLSVQGYPDYGDTLGWREGATGEDVAQLAKSKTRPGAIWILHNLSLADLHAFEEIVRFHLLEGYEIITVEEMLK